MSAARKKADIKGGFGGMNRSPPLPASEVWLPRLIQNLAGEGLILFPPPSVSPQVQLEVNAQLASIAALKGFITPRDVFYIVYARLPIEVKVARSLEEEWRAAGEEADTLLMGLPGPLDPFQSPIFLARQTPFKELKSLLQAFIAARKIRLEAADPREAETPENVATPGMNADLILKRLKDLATLPECVQAAFALLEDPEVDLKKIADLLGGDPAISARVLAVANSAFFCVRGRVGSLGAALRNIGIRGVRHIIVTATVLEIFGRGQREAIEAIWSHAARTAAWAGNLGRALRLHIADEAFTAGLLHDIGKLAIIQYFPDLAEKIRVRAARGENFQEAESAVIGMNHAEIGVFVAQFWKFPPETQEAIARHHDSVADLRILPSLRPLARMVHAACFLADQPSDPERTDWIDALPRDFLAFHGLSPRILSLLAPKIHQDASEFAVMANA